MKFIVLLLGIACAGCNKDPEPRPSVINTLTLESEVFTIPKTTVFGQQTLTEVSAILKLDSLVQATAPGYTRSEIRSVRVDSCWLQLTAGDALSNFANYSTLRVDMYSAKLPAYAAVARDDAAIDEFTFSKVLAAERMVDFRNYFRTDSFRFRLSGTIRRFNKRPLEGRVRVQYTMLISD